MHGEREGDGVKRRRTTVADVPAADSYRGPEDFFTKDGRKIQVGDCALFQSGNAPPFIGIIRWFGTGKENYFKLCVNWLYRPADVKLAKGISLEAAPNEVFYSFHRDEVPAASLLHPCKVAFLGKGFELPSGLSSFICRRVYDIENKCLWWLTDQDYINERQEEVDQLLDRTRLDMHALQSGGRSPKPQNGPASTQPLKSGSDGIQNSGNSFSSQIKGKKRERSDPGTDSVKQDHNTKVDEGDPVSFRPENMLKTEVAKITEKGGLVSFEGVEKLVQLMQLDRAERKVDLAGRILLADVIASTERLECLGRFVQLRGVPVLDDWLQEVQKGKIGDGSSPKDADKSVEELLLSLLRALDKLPVNLHALQTCHIGKSVNHLRNHKNLDIQKKARSIIDTWKKRVDAEMTKINDAKVVTSCQPVTWPAKQGFAEVSHGSNRRSGSSEAAMKSSIMQQYACKGQPTKPAHLDGTVKSPLVTTAPSKLSSSLSTPMTISPKESINKSVGSSGVADFASMTGKEEKNAIISQSQISNLSVSADPTKMIPSWKEDLKSSTSLSTSATKMVSGSSRYRRTNNGLVSTSASGILKDTTIAKSSSNRTSATEKISQSGLVYEKALDASATDHGNSQRLIVRLPNPGRSPARSASGCSLDEPSVVGCKASSPGDPDKHDYGDRRMKFRSAVSRPIPSNLNVEAWHGSDPKEGLAVPDEGDRSEGGPLHDEHCRSADETGKASDTLRASCSSSCNEKEAVLADCRDRNSFGINALIESCAKVSEAGGPLAAGDDVGMNLLASVATGEISKSHLVTPVCSPESTPATDEPCSGNSGVKHQICGDVAQSETQPVTPIDVEPEKNVFPVATSMQDEMHEPGNDFSAKETVAPSLLQGRTADMQAEDHLGSGLSSQIKTDACVNSDGKPTEERADKSISESTYPTEVADAQLQDKCMAPGQLIDNLTDCKQLVKSPSDRSNPVLEEMEEHDGYKNCFSSDRKQEMAVEEPSMPPSSCADAQKGNTTNEELCDADIYREMPVAAGIVQDANGRSSSDAVSSNSDNAMRTDRSGEMNIEKHAGMQSHLEPNHSEEKEKSCLATSSADRAGSITCNDAGEEMSETKEASARHSVGSANHEESSTCPTPETQQQEKTSGLVSGSFDREDNIAVLMPAKPHAASQCGFDLNEGFPGDDCNQNEPAISAALVHSPAVHLHGLSPFPLPRTTVLPAPITAAPGKRLFVPLDDLLKSKAELGWRSAATSAFRPAEPRKFLDMPPNASDAPSSFDTTVKRARPALDIDLNVADERILEDMASQSSAQTAGSECGVVNNHELPMRVAGGLDLDLNKVDECMDNGQFMASSSRKVEVPLIPLGPMSVGFQNGESTLSRDFDLNGPGPDELGIEPSIRGQQAKNTSVPLLPSFSSHRMNNTDLGGMSPWFPPNSYPSAALPSFLPDRGEQPYPIVPVAAGSQRVLASVTSGSTYAGDIYRGSMLSSSSAMAFSHATAFPYAGFPFGSNFPFVSASISGSSTAYADPSPSGIQCFSSIPSQLMVSSGAITSPYPRPYLISLPEGSGSVGSDSSRRWSRPGLDLNTGPGGTDAEVRVDRSAAALRQPPAAISSSQVFVEEQARMYQVAGGILKRKEPDGSWDAERYGYKQPWQ